MVRPISAAETRPVRHSVLRPDKPADALVYPGDDHPEGAHFGAYGDDGRLVGIATVYPEAPPEEHRGAIPDSAFVPGGAARLRGMATEADVRGGGHGRKLLEVCFDHARTHGATYLWCNARVGALDFYKRLGLDTFGEQFDIPGIGPHYVMGRAL